MFQETESQQSTTSYVDIDLNDFNDSSDDNNESSDHGIQFRQSLSLKLSMDELTLLDKNDTEELRTMVQETGEEIGGLLIGNAIECHYEILPMQYTENLLALKMGNFIEKF